MSHIFRIIILVTSCFILSWISHAQPAHFGEVFPKIKTAKRITKNGANRQPIFISNSAFVFVSKSRKNHKDPQLYFHDLLEGKEKRITHQRGDLTNGFYFDKKGEIIYSSSTDEEKETPYVLKKHLDRFPASVKNDSFFHVDFRPQEIYKSQIDGSDVQRLTEFSGYDGFPIYLQSKDRLYFSRWNKGQLSLYAKSMSKNLAPWKVAKTAGHDLGLQISPTENQFIWYRFSPDFKSSQVLLSDLNFKSPLYLTLESGVNWSPTWHPNGKTVIYSARTNNQRDFDLYEVSVNGECRRQLTSFSGDEFYPTVSPDGRTILFTSTQAGREQIYKMGYPEPLECGSKTE